jgi:hypothetical protein
VSSAVPIAGFAVPSLFAHKTVAVVTEQHFSIVIESKLLETNYFPVYISIGSFRELIMTASEGSQALAITVDTTSTARLTEYRRAQTMVGGVGSDKGRTTA